MRKTATQTYYCVAFAPNCVANCTATPDKLFPDVEPLVSHRLEQHNPTIVQSLVFAGWV